MKTSYPKDKMKVVLLENINKLATSTFKKAGYPVESFKDGYEGSELIEKIKDARMVGIRSKTKISREVLDKAKRLRTISAYCIGTNQIDLDVCTEKGIAVFNAPYSNTRSVVEFVMGEIIVLMRGIFEKSQLAHDGFWHKSPKESYEIRGKKLGIIGYGNIGSQLSVIAESFGMDVYYFDVRECLGLGNATCLKTMNELLKTCDVITLHVDGRAENENIIGKKQFDLMKKGVIFINASRGHVVDTKSFVEALKSKKVRAAAVDVYPTEPGGNGQGFESELRGMSNVILTPHIGGSTEEAQVDIADFATKKMIKYIETGNSMMSVNFPNLNLPPLENAHRLMHIHENVPGVMVKLNEIFSKHNINITGQYLKTNEKIGYVVTDIEKTYNTDVLKMIKEIPHTIKARILY